MTDPVICAVNNDIIVLFQVNQIKIYASKPSIIDDFSNINTSLATQLACTLDTVFLIICSKSPIFVADCWYYLCNTLLIQIDAIDTTFIHSLLA